MSNIKDGLPTGRLNANATMAEINCYTEPLEGVKVDCGTRWIPVTDEMRRQMSGCVVSMVDITPELASRLYKGEPDLPLELPVRVKDIQMGDSLGSDTAKDVVAADGYTVAAIKIDPQDIAKVTSPQVGTGVSMAASMDLEALSDAPAVAAFKTYHYEHIPAEDSRENVSPTKEENSGFNVSYYSVAIDSPKRPERAPYIFEVEDLIETLNMTFHEGTVLKSLVRSCVERELGLRKVGGDYIRDAEKMIHSSKETLRIRQIRAKKGLK